MFKLMFNKIILILKNRLQNIASVKEIQKELEIYKTCVPPGLYYSPFPDLEYIKKNEARIFYSSPDDLPGIKLNLEKQLELFEKLAIFYKDIPFEASKKENLRYWYENDAYQYSDAICLYSMIRHLKPKRIIEVGCGYSSCIILDTNEIFFDNSINCVFIDPYPDLLLSLIKKEDKKIIEVIPKILQDISSDFFRSLSLNDILFIDSSHVSKIDSDVNYLFFEILPHLNPGVHIHFHDVLYPFEYWPDLIYKKISWNEAYLLRAFLQYNNNFEIVFHNNFLEKKYPEMFYEKMPLCMKHLGGSIWLKKL